MSWNQVSSFRYAEDGIGWCLRQTQSTFSAPVRFNSAREAWDGQQGRHTDYPPLGIAVPIWFDHWGNYGNPAFYKNWGHVATRLPDGRVLTSPFWPKTYGYDIFPSIQAMMNALGGNAKYLGWSEYMNGRQIVSPSQKPTHLQEEDEMQTVIVDEKHVYGVSTEYVTHYGDTQQHRLSRDVMGGGKDHKIPRKEFLSLLDGLGIPREVVREDKVLNPQSGKWERNGTWSRHREILAKLGGK